MYSLNNLFSIGCQPHPPTPKKSNLLLSMGLDTNASVFVLSHAFFVSVQCTVHGTRKYRFQYIFFLKLDFIVLFTHLKIILLQYFQFLVFSFQ